MYRIVPQTPEILKELEAQGCIHTVFMTYAWVRFLEKNQKATPVILQLLDEEEQVVAYFVGMTVKRLGIKILGSPFEGWLTCDMGFIRISELDINDALRCVAKYAFKHLGCWYAQMIDKNISVEELDGKMKFDFSKDLCTSLINSEDEIYSNFSKEAKKNIRLFKNRGARIQQVPFDIAFLDVFYKQLEEVFLKQKLKPNYSKQKLIDLMESLRAYPYLVYAVQVFSPEDECIASAISLGYGRWCTSLATASFRNGQKFLPNETIRWNIMTYWKNKGCQMFDFCGYREYKLKFNPIVIQYPVIYFERIPGMVLAKKITKKIIVQMRKLKGMICLKK